jgi:hypothetical protein
MGREVESEREVRIMELVTLPRSKRIVFGAGALEKAAEIADFGVQRALLVTSTPIVPLARPLVEALEGRGVSVTVYSEVDAGTGSEVSQTPSFSVGSRLAGLRSGCRKRLSPASSGRG